MDIFSKLWSCFFRPDRVKKLTPEYIKVNYQFFEVWWPHVKFIDWVNCFPVLLRYCKRYSDIWLDDMPLTVSNFQTMTLLNEFPNKIGTWWHPHILRGWNEESRKEILLKLMEDHSDKFTMWFDPETFLWEDEECLYFLKTNFDEHRDIWKDGYNLHKLGDKVAF